MRALVLMVAAVMACSRPARPRTLPPVAATGATSVKLTVLSTMLAGDPHAGIGEWGFAALVEVDGQRYLLDTGSRPDTVLANARELGLDLSTVTDVVLTHDHGDHTGGLLALRAAMMNQNPSALSRAHIGSDFFSVRVVAGKDESEAGFRKAYEDLGGTFVEHAAPTKLGPHVWFTGPVPRVHPERNWSGLGMVRTAAGLVEDVVQEDSSLVVETPEGLVVISGCAHAGIVNITEYATRFTGTARVHAVLGGLHLFDASDQQLAWTASRLRELGVAFLLGAHCTGIEAVFRLREGLALTRKTAVVAAVGSTYSSDRGIDALKLAH